VIQLLVGFIFIPVFRRFYLQNAQS